MAGLWKRISKRMKMTTKGIRSDLHFSPYYAWLRLCDELGGRAGFAKLSARSHQKKDQWIRSYLEKNLKPVLDRLEGNEDPGTPVENAPIWVCWWTGEESAPPLVKKCIASIRRNAGAHPVHLITRDNHSQYLDIPSYILDRVDKGQMCVANFSDYLRFSLLAKHGGLWLDATIYCAAPLPEDIFRMPVFTCKGRTGNGVYISDYRWTAFCFGGYRGNILFRYFQAAFEQFWKTNKTSIDYLLVDYTIDLGYRKIPAIQAYLDQVPQNNMRRDDLQAAMNAGRPAGDWDTVVQPDTTLYKLSWREAYRETTPEGGPTVFGVFLQL